MMVGQLITNIVTFNFLMIFIFKRIIFSYPQNFILMIKAKITAITLLQLLLYPSFFNYYFIVLYLSQTVIPIIVTLCLFLVLSPLYILTHLIHIRHILVLDSQYLLAVVMVDYIDTLNRMHFR